MSEAAKPSNSTSRVVAWGLVVILAALTVGNMSRAGLFQRPLKIALVTASTDAYWDDVIIGAKTAAKIHNVQLTVLQPQHATRDEQSKIVNDLIKQGVDGIAISPIDPKIQAPTLKDAADATHLVTFDSDSPVAGRLCFVGTDNYEAGRRCGDEVREALPDGGQVAIFIGTLEKENGHRRRQGLIDELLDRSYNPQRETEPVDSDLSSKDFTIIATLIDKDDPNEAFANVRRLLSEHPDVKALVGLYGYHAPVLAKAVAQAGLQDQMKIVGFDYHPDTLAAIENGLVYATMAQESYNYGYNAIRVLADMSRERGRMGIPLYEKIHFPCEVITQDNLKEFRSRLKMRGNKDAANVKDQVPV